MKISRKWRERAVLYRYFAEKEYARFELDFSEKAAQEMFDYESYGKGVPEPIFGGKYNGFFLGKKLMDLMITSWREDCYAGYTIYYDLRDDFLAEVKRFTKAVISDNGSTVQYFYEKGYDEAKAALDWFDSIPLSNFSLGLEARQFYEKAHREAKR